MTEKRAPGPLDKIDMDTEVGWHNGRGPVLAGRIQTWAYRRIEVFPELLTALIEARDHYCANNVYDELLKTGCESSDNIHDAHCQKMTAAITKAQGRPA